MNTTIEMTIFHEVEAYNIIYLLSSTTFVNLYVKYVRITKIVNITNISKTKNGIISISMRERMTIHVTGNTIVSTGGTHLAI